MTAFSSLQIQPVDAILGVAQQYIADPNPNKVNLSVGVFQNKQQQTPIMKAVKKAEATMLAQQQSKVYTAQQGDSHFLQHTLDLICQYSDIERARLAAISVPGGCGALMMSAALLAQAQPMPTVWYSTPTWSNHLPILNRFSLPSRPYPYYDSNCGTVDFPEMQTVLTQAKADDVVLLHACCHNPTGADLNNEQWCNLFHLCQKKSLIPLLDMAYLGLGKGLKEDSFAVTQLLNTAHYGLICVSFSKTFGLYRERTGALIVVAPNQKEAHKLKSNILANARAMYSMAPYHGSGIVATLLSDPTLTLVWQQELIEMRQAMTESRQNFVAAMNKCQNQRDFSYILNNHGMFSYLNISPEQVQILRQQYAIYLLNSSRVNIVGVQKHNVDYITDCIRAVCFNN